MDFLILRNIQRRQTANRNKIRALRAILRETTEEEFVKLFPLTKGICRCFINLIEPLMDKRLYGLTKTTRVLCALRFLCSYQRPFGRTFLSLLHQISSPKLRQ